MISYKLRSFLKYIYLNSALAEFKKIQISIPDIEVQRKIETILRTIDKKIVVNESINRNLGLVA